MVCLANSFKIGGSCIAGKEKLATCYGEWIRPVSARETCEVWAEECRLRNGGMPEPLDIIDVPLLGAVPRQHQTENYLIDPARQWAKVGVLPRSELRQLCDHPPSLWTNGCHTRSGGTNNCIGSDQAAALGNSLLLIEPENFVLEVGVQERQSRPIRRIAAHFNYLSEYYALCVTDPNIVKAYRDAEEEDCPLEGVYLCVSLTEPYEKDGRCHKVVATVFLRDNKSGR